MTDYWIGQVVLVAVVVLGNVLIYRHFRAEMEREFRAAMARMRIGRPDPSVPDGVGIGADQ